MTQKHTPGPWTVHNMINEKGHSMTPEEIGEYVANSLRMGAPDRFLFISAKHEDGMDCDVCHIGNGPRGPYNARLIAAAPDLLEALKGCIGWIETSPEGEAATAKARAAIAKAEVEA